MKNIIAIHIGPITKYPPAISVVNALLDLGYEVTLITTKITTRVDFFNHKLKIILLDDDYQDTNLIKKFFRMFRIRKKLWEIIDSQYNNDSVLWVFSDLAVKHLGKKIFYYRYILHMFELTERVYYHRKFKFLFIPLEKIAQNAVKVIQAEENRAYISQAWWNLVDKPTVLPNKPYNVTKINKNHKIKDRLVREKIASLKGKKIILYQGILSKERPLFFLRDAMKLLPEKYVLVVMGGEKDPFENMQINNYCYISHVPAPLHLEVTSHAYIGILTYQPVPNEYSKLNTIYCAPNKIYEYSQFSIPMVGNDIPGLKYPFEKYGAGVTYKLNDIKSFVAAITEIDANYINFSEKSFSLYNAVDYKSIVKKVVSGESYDK